MAGSVNRLSHYASSPGHRPAVVQNLPCSSLAVAITIATTHFACQAELAWVAWLNTKMVYPRTVTHLSTNPARRRVTSLMCSMMLPIYH